MACRFYKLLVGAALSWLPCEEIDRSQDGFISFDELKEFLKKEVTWLMVRLVARLARYRSVCN